MAVSLSTISAIAGRKGNQYLEEQINFKSQLMGSKSIQKEKCEGVVRVINVQAGGLGSVSITTGGATYPTAESNDPVQLLVRPVNFIGHVSLPFDAAELVNGKAESIKLVRNHFELLGENLGQNLGRALLDGYLAGNEADATISGTSTATVSVSDITGFRINQIVDFYDTAVSAKQHTARVDSVTRDGDGTGSIGLSEVKNGSGTLLTSGTISEGDGIWVQGWNAPAAGFRFTSLADACGSDDLYGTTVSNRDWSGTSQAAGGALSNELMREVCDTIGARSGSDPTHTVMHRVAFQDYEQLNVSNRRYLEGDKLDAFGKNHLMAEFRGRPVVVDDNCPARQVFFLNDKAFKLGVWREFAPLGNGNEAEISQTAYSYLIKIAGMFNSLVERRNCLGRLTGVTIG